MLKVQFSKAESLRNEAHTTVEKMREEFDAMVREFVNSNKNEGGKNICEFSFIISSYYNKP